MVELCLCKTPMSENCWNLSTGTRSLFFSLWGAWLFQSKETKRNCGTHIWDIVSPFYRYMASLAQTRLLFCVCLLIITWLVPQSVWLLCLVSMENVPGGLPVVAKTRVGTWKAFFNLLLVVLSFKLAKFCTHVCLDVWGKVFPPCPLCPLTRFFFKLFWPTVCELKNGTSCEECLKNVTVSSLIERFNSAWLVSFLG